MSGMEERLLVSQMNQWLLALLVIARVCAVGSRCRSDHSAGPVKLTAEQDHERIMRLLNITSLPPGASGQHPNLDESKANPYPNLPDPLTLNNGQKVTTPEMWWNQRRPEILEFSNARFMAEHRKIRRP